MAPAKKKTGHKAPRKSAKKSPSAEVVDAEAALDEPAEQAAADADPAEPSEPEVFEEIDETGPGHDLVVAPAKERSLSRADPLTRYMQEATRHKLLTREEEHDLAVKLRETGDVQAAYRLVASNLRLVVKLAHEYHRNPIQLLDLIQEGNMGLMQAVKKYDPYRGVKLSSYAAWWIRAYILRYIMDNWKMVKLGTTEAQRKLFFKLRQEQDRLVSQGFEATPKLLAERLNVTEQDVVEMDQRLGHDELSLDAPVGEDGQSTRAERMPQRNAEGADVTLANEELKLIFREKLAEFSKTLGEKDRLIFEKRLIAEEPLTLQQIGTQWGVSRERARQIEAALINKIREYLRETIPDFDLVAAPED